MRFLSLLFTALALGPALAHLLELPNKINLSGVDYLTVQQIYRGWATLEIVVAGALLSILFLTIMVREQSKALTFTLIALLCIVGMRMRSMSSARPPKLNRTHFRMDYWSEAMAHNYPI
jgi:uncharacterized membrane protein YbjE (DUF340 family)